MVSETAEVDLQTKESPFWAKAEELTGKEKLALEGIVNMESLVGVRSKEPLSEFKFDYMATDMFEEAAKPLGFPSRSYRQDNYSVTGGDIEYPDYHLIPRLMKELGGKVEIALAQASANPGDISKVLNSARLAHEMIYIHPFRDFNGRISRGLVHYVLRRLGYFLPDWQFSGRGKYLDAVADGYKDGHAFEVFLAKALHSSYGKVAATFQDVPDDKLSGRALDIKKTATAFGDFS